MTEVKPEVTEKLAEMKQESQTRAERAATVNERLEKIIHPQTVAEQPSPMSSENQTTEEAKPQPEPVKQSQDEEQPTLPDSSSERTKEQFNKLLEENRKLKEDRRKAAGSSVFDSLRPTEVKGVDMSQFGNLNPQTTNDISKDFIGPDGVDVDGLNKALRQASERAQLAEIEVAQTRQKVQELDERQQVREAHSVYPELDPTDVEKFDPNFYDLVALRIAKSGMKMTLSDAAADVRKTYNPGGPVNLNKVKDEAVTQYKENLSKRDQGPLSTGKGEPRVTNTNPELRERTRKGDAYALDERLRKLGLIT